MKNYSVGSLWRKWDLHVHTPASFHWNGGKHLQEMSAGERDKCVRELIETMNDADADVFGIMDYWTFDGYLAIRDFLSRNPTVSLNKTILPGMELRCEAPADYRLNIHVLLSDELSTQQLSDFKSGLKLVPSGRPLSDEALETLHERFTKDKLAKASGNFEHELKTRQGKYMLGAKMGLIQRDDLYESLKRIPGKGFLILPWETYGGAEKLDWGAHPAVVTDFMNHADIYETRRACCVDLFHGRKNQFNANFIEDFMQSIERPRGTVSGSDAHSLADYAKFPAKGKEGERATWIKADPTFEGLRQAVCEPKERCFIGTEPPARIRVRNAPTKYFSSVSVRKKAGSPLQEQWFDFELALNPGLVAVIGNKGSGKSALADIVGLLADSSRGRYFSFLTETKFRLRKNNKAEQFNGTLKWHSGERSERNLSGPVSPNAIERARYIPQSYLEQICNEVDLGSGSEFDRELKGVIFSHVPEPQRLGKTSLDELLQFKREQASEELRSLRDDLHRLNVEISRIEDDLTQRHKDELEGKLRLKRSELSAHDSLKPVQMEQPGTSAEAKERSEAESVALDLLRAEVSKADTALASAKDREAAIALKRNKLDQILFLLKGFEQSIEQVRERISAEMAGLPLSVDEVLSAKIDTSSVMALDTEFKKQIRLQQDDQSEKVIGSTAHVRRATLEEIALKVSALEGPLKRYQEHKQLLSDWERKRQIITGDPNIPESITGLETMLKALSNLPGRLTSLMQARRKKADEIHQAIMHLASDYKVLYSAVQRFAEEHPVIATKFKLTFDVKVRPVGFADKFFGMISQGVVGSFYGVEDGYRRLNNILASHDFSDEGSGSLFAQQVVEQVKSDFRQSTATLVSVDSQLKRGTLKSEFYDFLFGLTFLHPQYALQLDGKELSQLSPGERGTLLLMFYLLVDQDDVPLIIDQPEENLDNQTVFTLVGECLREAKRRRQVVVVTHNPNIAVACDADQVIIATHDSRGSQQVSYISGGIENPEINSHLLDILEGTRPAFDNRDSKYRRS